MKPFLRAIHDDLINKVAFECVVENPDKIEFEEKWLIMSNPINGDLLKKVNLTS